MNRRESMTTHDINNTNDPQKKHRLGTVSKTILRESLNQFNGASLALNSDLDQDTFEKVTKLNKHDRQEVTTRLQASPLVWKWLKVGATTKAIESEMQVLIKPCNLLQTQSKSNYKLESCKVEK